MKNKVILLLITGGLFSCNAQQSISLSQMEECATRPNRGAEGCPDLQGAEFVKDTENKLDQFEGIWKGSYNGKQIELNLVKKIDFGEYYVKWDKIIGKMRIKDAQNQVLFDSFSNPENKANPYGDNFQKQEYVMLFTANGDCFDEGSIFLQVQQVGINNSNPPQLQLVFIKSTGGETTKDLSVICPNYATYQTMLPHNTKVFLTKQ